MLRCDKNRLFLTLRETFLELLENFWCPLTESNCQSMITSQVLYHLTKGACADVAGFTTVLLLVHSLPIHYFLAAVLFPAKPNILTYFTNFRLGLPLEIGVFLSSVGSGGVVFSTGKDMPWPFSLA